MRIAHTPLCTISVNVDCRDEFVVCHGVYAMTENWTFWHVILRFYARQTVSIEWHLDGKSCALFPETAKSGFGSSDFFRSQEAERILLCETVNSCWQWTRSKHHVRVPKRGSYYLVNNSVRSRNHTMSVTLNLGAVRIIWPASKPVHILCLKPLHSRVRSQSALIVRSPTWFPSFLSHIQ